ncbi:unnamed protein product [Danaus chrysippus]|uniref:(African queen) hypothetical protein n=1 Tax=Danaus chrysippus TaxID=151541 RepID=A0A8J2QGK4_9NEOP|nr:unnamed protein product [Danaus chrysippus]
MEEQDRETNYNNVVDKLLETFGEILSRDVMLAIVESYEGDLNESANAVMNISMDGNCMNPSSSGNVLRPNNMYSFRPNNPYVNHPGIRLQGQPHMSRFYPPNGFFAPMANMHAVHQPPMSYAAAYHQMSHQMINQPMRPMSQPDNKMQTIKPIPKVDQQNDGSNNTSNLDLQTIYKHHENGHRTLIILRGAPGSGKTFLAHKIIDTIYNKRNNNYNMHIFSTDQFFIRKGVYEYCRNRLSEAHDWNQKRAYGAMRQGISPVIIDNTNSEIWEMKPYVESGVKFGYIIEVLEPDTPWARKAQILCKKNSHNVPFANIKRMLENLEQKATGPSLLHQYSLQYEPTMTPPILRSLPPFNGRTPEELGTTNKRLKYVANGNNNARNNNFNQQIKQQSQNASSSQKTYSVSANSIKTNKSEENQFFNALDVNNAVKDVKGNSSQAAIHLDDPTRDDMQESPTTTSFSICQEEKEKQEDNSELSSFQNESIVELDNASGVSSLVNDVKGDENQEIISSRTSPNSDSLKGGISFDVEAEVATRFEKEKNHSVQEVKDTMNKDDVHKTLEAFEKVEIEWESGEQWEADSAKKEDNLECQGAKALDAKPQRQHKAVKVENTDSALKGNLTNCQDWTKIGMFLPPWSDEKENKNVPDAESSIPLVEKISSFTCFEIGDTNISHAKNLYRIISAKPRDINEFHLPLTNNKIPDQWMLDKSTSTHDNQMLSPIKRCKNEEEHFKVFSRLFKNVDVDILRDIFDKCCGDINWAVDIVLDDMASENVNNIMANINTPIHDIDMPELDCDCLSAYNIIPERLEAVLPENQITDQTDTQSTVNLKKNKKEIAVSEASIELKKQIEGNIVIPDNHYSERCLKLRKLRRGEVDTQENIDSEDNTDNTNIESSTSAEALKTTDQNSAYIDNNLPSTSKMDSELPEISDTASCVSADEDGEKTVNICIGREFVTKLDEIFGGQTAECLSFINPTVNIPMSLLSIINALWIESLTDQLQEDSKQSKIMMEQDAELARLLAAKEEEFSRLGQEPEIPDFKEIMDMDYALSIYQRDVSEWRNNLPDDLAAKLSRDKLYNLFPSVSPDVLSELLAAHDNNFHLTVEVLLTSTGQTDILKAKNGVNKFIVQKEMERHEKLLQEEKKALSEVEWPLLPKNEKVDMSTVQHFRNYADKHLRIRNDNYNKASEYFRRGMTQVSTYYLELAHFHKTRFEHSNSMAVASLIQVHAANSTNNATIDLHYLRVREAKEALDLFLDTHIQKLKELQTRSSVRSHNLFFITGRGLHSQGKPKIKPAVKKRLLERGLTCSERNPGLLTAKVCADDKLTYEIA